MISILLVDYTIFALEGLWPTFIFVAKSCQISTYNVFLLPLCLANRVEKKEILPNGYTFCLPFLLNLHPHRCMWHACKKHCSQILIETSNIANAYQLFSSFTKNVTSITHSFCHLLLAIKGAILPLLVMYLQLGIYYIVKMLVIEFGFSPCKFWKNSWWMKVRC